MEQWKTIPEFPSYGVSTFGRVVNDETGREMIPHMNQSGVVNVGLTKNRIQHRRSLALLVAEAFLEKPTPNFDTPIHLDGDAYNNRVENLMWRPRWYAIRYKAQFGEPRRGITEQILDIGTGELYDNSWHVATVNGLLERDVVLAIGNRTYTAVTYQRFELA